MKLRFLLLFLLVSVIGNAQYINRDGYTIWQGDMGIKKTTRPVTSALLELGKDSTNKALVLPRVVDTSVITSPVKGMMVYVIPLQQIYFYNGIRWVTWQNNSCPDDLIGSATWSGTALNYEVTILNYHILCNPYTTADTTVTLPAAHPTLDRKDLIICDIFSQVSVLPGVPGSGIPTPINPFTQKIVAIVDVHAGWLTPYGQSITTIYDENVEWASSSTVSIIDFAATTPAPYTGTVSTNVTTPADGTYIQWQRPTGAADISNGQYLKFRIKLSGQPTSGRLFLTVTFYDNATQSTNNFIVADGSYGLDYSSTDWQLIVIPIISPFYSTTADRVQFVINNASGISFQLDKVYLLEGSNPPPIASGIDWLVGGNFLTGIRPAWLGSLDKRPFSLVTTGVPILTFSEDGIEENNTNDVWMLMRRESDGMVFKRKLDSVITLGCLKSYDSAGLKVIRDTCNGGSGTAWALTGNAGTDPNTNFIGTTDDIGLKFKVNNTQSGYIDKVRFSTSLGIESLLSNTGSYNNAFGYASLFANLGGIENNAFGHASMFINTTGNYNNAYGYSSLYSNNASENNAFGYRSLQNNTTGGMNSGFGDSTGTTLTTGTSNTLIGANADVATSSTDSSIALGYKAVAASHQFALSPYFTQIKATGITGATTNGYVLTTDGTGVATFQAASGGSSLFPTSGTGTATAGVAGDLNGNTLTLSGGAYSLRYNDMWVDNSSSGIISIGDMIDQHSTIQLNKNVGGKDIIFSTNTLERVRIDSLGNIGIGSATPDSLLTVNGGLNLAGGIYTPNIPGAVTSGYVLTTDGTGVLTFQAAAISDSLTPFIKGGAPYSIVNREPSNTISSTGGNSTIASASGSTMHGNNSFIAAEQTTIEADCEAVAVIGGSTHYAANTTDTYIGGTGCSSFDTRTSFIFGVGNSTSWSGAGALLGGSVNSLYGNVGSVETDNAILAGRLNIIDSSSNNSIIVGGQSNTIDTGAINSAIIGGTTNSISLGKDYVVILGKSSYNATRAKTTYVDSLDVSGKITVGGTAISSTATQLNYLNAATGTTGTTSTNLVYSTSPTLVTPILGTPTSVTLTNATGLPISTGVSGLGTGVATALAVNVGSAGAPVVNGGALGTPSSGTLTNTTGLPISTGVSGLGAGVATLLAATPSGSTSLAGTASPTFTGTLTAATISIGTTISGAGTWTAGAINTSSNITGNNIVGLGIVRAAAGSLIGWTGRTSLTSTADGAFNVATNGGTSNFSIGTTGALTIPTTITTAGTTGNQTINKPSGTVNIAAAGTTVTVTNSLVSTSSIVYAVIRTNDATARISNVVPAAGSFTINIVACTAEVSIGFFVIN